MTEEEIRAFQAVLRARRAEVVLLSENAAEARKPVALDQQSIGRLSRQDALQQQAMAKAQDARRATEIRRIDAALARIEGGDFGYCDECGEEISLARLNIDPMATRCVGCAV